MSLTLLNYTSHGVRTDAFLTVNLSEGLVSLEQGGTVDITATVNRSRVGIGTPVISFGNLPAGLTGEVIDTVGTGSLRMLYTIRITASGSAAIVNAQSIRVTATAPDGTTGSAFLGVTVLEPPDEPGALFVLSASPSTFNVVQDATAATTISLVRAGPSFTADVALAVDETLPSGVTAAFGTTTLSGGTLSTTLTFTATDVATLGGFTATVRGTSSGVLDGTTVLNVTVVETGAYAYLAPLYALPIADTGASLTYNASTARIEGDVVDVSDLDRSFLVANADTVVTIKTSGGDYTPAEIQNAINDAAGRNDLTVIVVDAGLSLPRHETRYKNVTSFTDANWTVICSSTWWSGDWAPTGNRWLYVEGMNDETSNLFFVNSGVTGNVTLSAIRPRQNERNQHKYAYIGARVRRNPSMPTTTTVSNLIFNAVGTESSTQGDQTPFGFVMHWCWVDGGNPSGAEPGPITVGFSTNTQGISFQHTLMTGLAVSLGEPKAVLISPRCRYLQFRNVLVENNCINVLIGGSNTDDPELVPKDMLFQNVCIVKRLEWNPTSSVTNGLSVEGANSPNKQGFEIKFGERIAVDGLDILNSWRGSQRGTGFSVQLTVQDYLVQSARLNARQITKDITARHIRSRNTNTWIGITLPNGSLLGHGLDAMGRIDIKNGLFVKGRPEDLNSTTTTQHETFLMFGYSQRDGLVEGGADLIGPLVVEHCTFTGPSDGRNMGRWSLQAQYQDLQFARDLSLRFRNNILGHAASGSNNGIRSEGITVTTNNRTGANALSAVTDGGRGEVSFGKNAMSVNGASVNRASFTGLYPEQVADELWCDAIDDYGFVAPALKPVEGDWRLAAESPLKGLADGGRDLGADIDLIETAVAGLIENVPSFITLTEPEP
jgi:hypothetical protein